MGHEHAISKYMEHGECFLWEPGLVWLHVISDIVTGIAYYSIPFGMFYFAYKRRDLPFHGLFLLFGGFILACGTTHMLAAYTVYIPDYWVEGGVKAFTALISAVTAAYFIPRIPEAIAMPSLTKSLEENRELNAQLEKRLEELEQQKSLMNAVIGGTNDSIFVKDTAGRYLLANKEVTRVFNKPLEEIIGQDDTHFFPIEEASLLIAGDREIMNMAGPVTREEHVTTVDGQRTYMATKGPIRDGQGKVIGLFGISRDITDQKKMEDQLRQSQKIETVGRLAGGIAHDFNNLLTVINGYSELLLHKVKDKSPLSGELEEIKLAGERAAALTRQLLAFSRRQVLQPKVLDLNEVISHMDMMLRRLIGEDVEFRTVSREDLWKVKADPGQIEQVVMNLVVNARDAMPGGGRLTIETSNVFLDEEYSHVHPPVQPGSYVMLSVSDTGVGMDEKTASQVFEPFFTTKELGKGTGLGLSTVYGIVKQSGGFIWVYSEPGKGSTFKVYLPCTADRGVLPDKEGSPVEDLRGEKSVLVVEDEESIRRLATEILGRYGYAVFSAGDGEEALRIATSHEGEIDLLLTDVIMPGMGGPELFERIRQLRPGIKVLYVSGYTNDAIVHQGVLDPGIAFLQKPYSPTSLVRKVKDVLEEN
jgi:PAS domain S-box-containing protein